MSKTLEQLVNELVDQNTIANTNLDDIPWNTQAAWASSIERAKETVVALREDYMNRILGSSVAIFALGGTKEDSDKFASIARDEAEVLVIYADDLYKRLAQPVDAALGGERRFTANSIPILLRAMKEVGNELGIRELMVPSFGANVFVPDGEALLALVRRFVRESCGDSLNQTYMAKKLAEVALSVRYKGSVAPVIVLNATPEEVIGLSPMFSCVGAQVKLEGTEVNKDMVLASFEKALKQVRKNKKNTN